ncbi:MAG: hypothetical protein EOO41_03580 [Methanobacteriota archaeon]|nr:MAG: hypothetical protein EOO41_03580 [Euryarchaeota archaeon]
MGGRMSAPQSARLPSIRERGQSAAGVSAGQGILLPVPWSVRSTGSSPAGTVSEGAGATAFALPQAPGSATQRSSEGGLLSTSPIPVGNSAVLVAGMHAVSSFETIGSALTAGSGAASSILDRSASNASIPADAASSWHGVERHMSPHGPPSSVTSSSSLFMSAHPVPGAGSVGRHWAHATSPSEPSSRGTTPHA